MIHSFGLPSPSASKQLQPPLSVLTHTGYTPSTRPVLAGSSPANISIDASLGRLGRIDTLDARRGNGGKIVEKFTQPGVLSPAQISSRAPPVKMLIVGTALSHRTRALSSLTGWQVQHLIHTYGSNCHHLTRPQPPAPAADPPQCLPFQLDVAATKWSCQARP
jgi:hypothetical protein